ncbi:MAG: tryptophan synthase subunit alpha [Longimicrobiales bacterium]
MGPLTARLLGLRRDGRRALIPYVTAGYPERQSTLSLLEALVGAGADTIELGVPFSDPVADGPTIQRSSQRALENGVTMTWVLEVVAAFRARHDVPVVLFTYLNPVLCHGVRRFLDDATSAGAHGLLLTDLPVGADPGLEATFEESELALVRLIAPTTSQARALEIAQRTQGFLYYIARMGVTGASSNLREALSSEVASLRAVTDVPIAVGFGISTPEQAAAVARVADGVVVGSALIDALDRGGSAGAARLITSLRQSIDAV